MTGDAPHYVYIVSDAWDKELPVFVGDTPGEVSEYLGISKRSVSRNIRMGWLRGHRWRIEKIPLDGD